MKKIVNKLLIGLLLAVSCHSCNYLDIVPDENATEADAFKNISAAEKFLYSCYAYMKKPSDTSTAVDLLTGDDVVTAWEHEDFAKFAKGDYTPSTPGINYWNDLYKGIRQCYLLKQNIESVPGITQEQIDEYNAEADFLIAYHHYYLLRMYGPVVLVKELVNLNDEKLLGRSPYDECVEWIAEEFKSAAGRLPDVREGDDYGRATSIIAMALRARMLLYAASPQFNGGEKFRTMYSQFRNPDGTQLISTTYDHTKWDKAVAAYQNVLKMTEGIYELYKGEGTGLLANAPEPTDATLRNLRFTFVDKNNTKEVIWAHCGAENQWAIQAKSVPRWGKISYGGLAITLRQIERFYTQNGLPIDEDPKFAGTDWYKVVSSPADWQYGRTNQKTLQMNLEREPRFYAWVAFQEGYYEVKGINKTTEKNSFSPEYKVNDYKQYVQFCKEQNMGVTTEGKDGTKTGYLNKKATHPATSVSDKGITVEQYPWPMIRLGEVYLGYAEACIEAGNLDEGKKYLNYIRERAGIPAVEDSWRGVASLDQTKLREIVHRERLIELYLENHNFWDLRRWGIAETLGEQPEGLSVMEKDIEKFAQPTTVDVKRRFVPAHYLLPIPIEEINMNPNMVQNPGYND
ncbi:RagB/SusD family nutrient uptake outer membrane protein [Bacteroides sp.]|uniref:RagB/SusD family nutrient uptake outer membrane protein n=1 Tax=Bacteroides sp. TaxID=29523 RepID=UPI0040271B1C